MNVKSLDPGLIYLQAAFRPTRLSCNNNPNPNMGKSHSKMALQPLSELLYLLSISNVFGRSSSY